MLLTDMMVKKETLEKHYDKINSCCYSVNITKSLVNVSEGSTGNDFIYMGNPHDQVLLSYMMKLELSNIVISYQNNSSFEVLNNMITSCNIDSYVFLRPLLLTKILCISTDEPNTNKIQQIVMDSLQQVANQLEYHNKELTEFIHQHYQGCPDTTLTQKFTHSLTNGFMVPVYNNFKPHFFNCLYLYLFDFCDNMVLVDRIKELKQNINNKMPDLMVTQISTKEGMLESMNPASLNNEEEEIFLLELIDVLDLMFRQELQQINVTLV